MSKNTVTIVIVVLALMVAVETAYIVKVRFLNRAKMMTATAQQRMGSPAPGAGRASGQGQPPAPLMKGDKLADNALAKSAYLVFPGDLSDAAKTALTGWTLSTTKNVDGTTTVTMIPKDSDDQMSSYKMKPGEMLYFVEMNAGDDHADSDTDTNLQDDYGIITDANGIVQ